MLLREISHIIESFAPLHLQEKYDNSGLQIGEPDMIITGALIAIDITESVLDEAIAKRCNLIISHHPLIFSGLKSLTGKNEVEKCVLKAIKNDVAIYCAHTNMDNVIDGVSGKMAEILNLKNIRVLQPSDGSLMKLAVFVPKLYSFKLREALFEAGAGQIGDYDSCSYSTEGLGTFRAGENANPFVGEPGKIHTEPEVKIEVVFPANITDKVLRALFNIHPYEEPAYDLIQLKNRDKNLGSGIVGELENEVDESVFLNIIKTKFKCLTIRHSDLCGKKIKTVALCGGSGKFLLANAIAAKADIFISADFKYHDFFEAEKRILMADIGHFESEQFTKDIFYEIITKKIPTFAIQISEINTNPINYL